MQHETLLRVRKEGNAHEKYNSFRSAFEILETIGKPPADDIEKHYQRPVSLLAKVERLEQELAQQKQELAQQKQESAQQMAAIDALVALLQEKGVIEKGAAGAASWPCAAAQHGIGTVVGGGDTVPMLLILKVGVYYGLREHTHTPDRMPLMPQCKL